MVCNVGVDEIQSLAKAQLKTGWVLREFGVEASGPVNNGSRPIVFDDDPPIAIERLLNWRDSLKKDTGRKYRERAAGQLRSAHLDVISAEDARNYAYWIQLKTRNCAASTRRQYRSSAAVKIVDLLSLQSTRDDIVKVLVGYLLLDAACDQDGNIDAKKSTAANERNKANSRTKATRSYFPKDDFAAVSKQLFQSRSERADIAVAMLDIIKGFGHRPIEVHNLRWWRDPRTTFWIVQIENAKFDTAGDRANGQFRHLTYRWLGYEGRRKLAFVKAYASQFATKAEWAAECKAIQKLIRRACEKLWPKNKGRRYGLYSGRHQFAADMKLAYEDHADCRAIVAALMGHSSDLTATMHYARSNKGSARAVVPKARRAEVELVRRHPLEIPDNEIELIDNVEEAITHKP
ncbi:hypothetical protein R2A130_3602 [Ahrensia sp. R2A130]|nr:hypothetical protein R2A130_3602 [Ahrensia sp. R2A130]